MTHNMAILADNLAFTLVGGNTAGERERGYGRDRGVWMTSGRTGGLGPVARTRQLAPA